MGPELADHIWIVTVRIIDVYWSTRVINLRAKIGNALNGNLGVIH